MAVCALALNYLLMHLIHTSDASRWSMQPVVLSDVQDVEVSSEHTLVDDANLEALAQSVVSLLDSDMLCLDVLYAIVGCVIAYVMASH